MNRAQCIDQLSRQLLFVKPERISLEVWDKKHGYRCHVWVDEGINGYRFGQGLGKTLSDSLFLLLYSVARDQESICKWAWETIRQNDTIRGYYEEKKRKQLEAGQYEI